MTSQVEYTCLVAGANGHDVNGVVLMALDVNGTPQAANPNGGIPIYDAYLNPVITTWNSGTATSTAVSMNTAGMDTVALTISAPAGITGGTIQFNVFDGAAWVPVKCARMSTYNTDSTYTILAGQINGWTVPAAGYPQFQVILTGAITGVGNVTITSIVSSAPATSIVTAGIDPLSLMPTMLANTTNNNLLQSRAFTPAATTPVVVKATAGKVHKIYAMNTSAAIRYLKVYNAAAPVVGTTPVFKTYQLPIGATPIDFNDLGLSFSTAISYSVTVNPTDADTTAPAANDVLVQVDYI